MHFPTGNHPSQTFPANQDAFPRWKSSLQDISSKSGCISTLGIIPHGNFQQIRMHFSARNHPSQKFPANQDAFPRWKSSLTDIFSKSRCISPTEIIPPEIIPLRIIPPQTIPSPTKKLVRLTRQAECIQREIQWEITGKMNERAKNDWILPETNKQRLDITGK